MKSNPGGYIDPKNVIGRDSLIAQIWEVLELQSIYINAERRIGKTTVLSILKEKPGKNWFPVKYDLERIRYVDEFATAIYKSVEQFLTNRQIATRRAKTFLESVKGIEVGGILKLENGNPLPWDTLLEKSIQDIDNTFQDKKQRILFLWDEVSSMLENICNREGEMKAMEVLDMLRYLRQTYPLSVRMVLTSSIGLHHVLSRLKSKGYTNAPTNDLASIEVRPLAPADGKKLASLLLKSEAIATPNLAVAANAITQCADHFPYYIHHLARRLKFGHLEATPENVEKTLISQITDANDPWELQHYRDRIPEYYQKNEALALAVLDILATTDSPLSQDQLFSGIKSARKLQDKEELRAVLRPLERDNYICRNENGHYLFRFGIIRRWWKIDRGL